MFSDALCRRFVKDSDNIGDPKVRFAYGRLAGIVGIVCNLLLCGFKLLAGVLAGSLAMIADAFNNLSDAGSAIVTLIGFKLAGAPPDKDHPFGHGRMEYLSAMGVAVLIILAGFANEDDPQAPFVGWYVLRAKALEPTLGQDKADSVEIGLKQLFLPDMEQKPLMLVVISQPLEAE